MNFNIIAEWVHKIFTGFARDFSTWIPTSSFALLYMTMFEKIVILSEFTERKNPGANMHALARGQINRNSFCATLGIIEALPASLSQKLGISHLPPENSGQIQVNLTTQNEKIYENKKL